MEEKTTIDEIRRRLADKFYEPVYAKPPARLPAGYVQDENQSVVWNREYVQTHNRNCQAISDRNRENENAMARKFNEDLVAALEATYGLTHGQASVVAQRACESGHSEGYHRVVDDACELCGFWSDMLAAGRTD